MLTFSFSCKIGAHIFFFYFRIRKVSFAFVQATCPIDGNKILSPSEFSETVEDRLSKNDATPEGGCSVAFIESLKIFLNKYVETQKRAWSALLADNESDAGKTIIGSSENDNIVIRKKVVQNIAGVTHRQLQVLGKIFH